MKMNNTPMMDTGQNTEFECHYTKQQSLAWLLERTFHAQLSNGENLSVTDLTEAMKQLTDCSIALSTWQEISAEEAKNDYQNDQPILLYSAHTWKQNRGTVQPWSLNKNMRAIIYGYEDILVQTDTICGTEHNVCYLDKKRGHFANTSWKKRFASDLDSILADSDLNTITFLRPCPQFLSTIHYTVIDADGQSHEYTSRTEAVEGFTAFSPREENTGNTCQTTFPQFCYYHEIIYQDSIYRLEFLGPRMDAPGYQFSTHHPSGWQALTTFIRKLTIAHEPDFKKGEKI